MVLFPSTGLGRLLLVAIIITTLSFLILNLVSFGGTSWITYVDFPIRFGLWRVCDTTTSGLCNQWPNSPYTSNITRFIFFNGKPSFVRSAEALEIISLIFYLIAIVLIIFGILDLDGLPSETMFLAAAALLFICIIFISASLGVMSVQGRSGHPLSFLDWAWWNGFVGLIMMIICFIALIGLVLDLGYSPSMNTPSIMQKDAKKKDLPNSTPFPPLAMGGNIPPVITPNGLISPSYNPYSQFNYSNEFFQNPTMVYGGQYPLGQSFYDQTPSPIISGLARQYVLQATDAHYERRLLEPYRQYLQHPYLINNYL